MSTNAFYPYISDEITLECSKCKKKNSIKIIKQDGHNESEECCCANCGNLLMSVSASLPPQVYISTKDM